MMRQLWHGDSWMSRQEDERKFYIIPPFPRSTCCSTFSSSFLFYWGQLDNLYVFMWGHNLQKQ
jgi:hypothetical protein